MRCRIDEIDKCEKNKIIECEINKWVLFLLYYKIQFKTHSIQVQYNIESLFMWYSYIIQ